MKKLLLFILLFNVSLSLFIASSAYCQDNFPKAFEINTDTAVSLSIPNIYWQYYPEQGKQFTLTQVSDPAFSAQFKSSPKVNMPEMGTYWFRYKIKNNLKKDVTIAISENLSRADLYFADTANKWQHLVGGNDVKWSEQSGLKKFNRILYTIPAQGEITVYEKDFIKKSINDFGIQIGFKDAFINQYYINNDGEYLHDAFILGFAGFFTFALIINLFFFFVVRESRYLFSATIMLLLAIINLTGPLYYLFFKETPVFIEYVQFLNGPFITYIYIITTLVFLHASKKYPRLNRGLLISNHLYVIGAIVLFMLRYNVQLLPYRSAAVLTLNTLIDIVLVIILILVIVSFKTNRQARLLMLALAPFLIIFILLILFRNNPSFNWLGYGINTTIPWSVLVLTWMGFDRFREIINENTLHALANERLAREKEEERSQLIAQQKKDLEIQVAERTAELSHSLDNLKQTQNQLIQSEKMASLGELTAGIAHEIQNPLNFVNNFSDVSVELVDEMQLELNKGDKDEAIAISEDIKQNLEKIRHHGQRADGIVKGMLQHSRASSTTKEPTNINKLADEYLRLAYQGLRAKDKTFNAELVTNFDENLPKVNVVPQDIGRVLLNLFNNAFYATQQKQKIAGDDYKPTITLTTFAPPSGGWGTKVTDNGTGIPDAIKDKILQPFFTTKPTGEGTGLGLSLSYDIVVKGHSGTIEINSKEGEGSEFIINLPI